MLLSPEELRDLLTYLLSDPAAVPLATGCGLRPRIPCGRTAMRLVGSFFREPLTKQSLRGPHREGRLVGIFEEKP